MLDGGDSGFPARAVCRYFRFNALALVLSVTVHLVFLFYFSNMAGGNYQAFVPPGFAPRLMTVDLSDKSLSSLRVTLPNNSSDVTTGHAKPRTAHSVPTAVPEADSLFPRLRTAKPHYFSAKELTRKLLIARDIPSNTVLFVPGVPEQAATLRIQVNEYGDVDKVIVGASLLPEAAQKLLVDEFAKIKFHPGEINGAAVKSELDIEIILKDSELKELPIDRRSHQLN
jgi:hypothetical protein